MMNTKYLNSSLAVLAVVSITGLSGCANEGIGGGDYNREQVRGEQTVRLGVVEQVRLVKIEGTRSGVGAGVGAVAGGVAGSTIGGGNRAPILGAIGGAVLGGLAGQAIEQSSTKKDGVEVTVRLDNGSLIAVTQGADEQFRVGDRVRVLSGGGATRVSH
jgi:outer membrane lipoprotein SlyB